MFNAEIAPFYKQDKESMLRVMRQVDKANGYVFGDLEERDIQSMMSCAVQAEFEYEKIKDVREKYMDTETGDIDMDNWWTKQCKSWSNENLVFSCYDVLDLYKDMNSNFC